ADLQPVIDELSAFIDRRATELKTQGKLADLYPNEPFEKRYGFLFDQCKEISKGLDIMQIRGRAMFEFLHNPNLLDVASSLVGPEVTCNPIQHIRSKPPSAYEKNEGPGFHNVPWHQDAGVMMPEADLSNVLTFWLPIGDATAEMGCMRILPGVPKSHGYLKHQREGGTTIWPELLPEIEPVVAACQKGDIVVMDKFTPHRSTPNRTDLCRWSMDLRYQPTGDHTGRTAHPEFVVRSQKNPESVMDDYEAWCRLWMDAFENPRGMSMHRNER
ncbi:MAG: phytanoyl-CoA dioxygenase family protein, partial [bacterium]|nr:phytanoyl-CoA dioxygenase family protein [bacterium]